MHMEKILPTPPDPRVARLMRVVGHFERDQIEQAVDSLIALLDAADGDPDVEPNGDELDGTYAEDDFVTHSTTDIGAGCPISDAGESDDEDHEPMSRPAKGARKSREAHTRRIRRTACRETVSTWGGHTTRDYRLRNAYPTVRLGMASELIA